MSTRGTENPRVPIAVIGMACWYPGARDIRQFWENILARRREFRRIPDCRLPLSEYCDTAGEDLDKTYIDRAAFIDGFQFDWVGKRTPKSTYETADIVHWLALETARQAVTNAGYTRDTLPRDSTGLVLGNTLCGEQTRCSTQLRFRWPYMRKALASAARARQLPERIITELCATTEQYYKSAFPQPCEDSLPGGMSNTIAGRVCNALDVHGGGYTVDGACSSSLIAVATAASHLLNGELDVALAGGVDVSLDTFELVGFARIGAITKKEMQVYDRRASGFLPGEGCGMVVLKRLEDARRDGNYVYAVLNGWGISSDGKGGLTAPGKVGQSLAVRRAYEHAGYSPRELSFIEGHGTGTAVGDPVELEAIAENLNAGSEAAPKSCGITSVKTIIGHAKAAAGVAGFIKAVAAVNRRILPPIAGIRDPNPLFDTTARALYPILEGEARDPSERIRAGVQAMGFGGINCHMTIESADPPSEKLAPSLDERALLVSNQLTEVFVLSADTMPDLLARLDAVRAEAAGISYGELTDLAAELARAADVTAPVRAAVVAGLPSDLVEQLSKLEQVLSETPPAEGAVYSGVLRDVWASNRAQRLRVGFLFPGQGSQRLNMGRVLSERHTWAREQVRRADEWLASAGAEPVGERMIRPLDRAAKEQVDKWTRELTRTEVAQPAICLASIIWFRHLTERLGIQPTAVAGHSLGELTAFHAAGAFGDEALLKLAAVRGQAMAAKAGAAGTMASLACPADRAEQILGKVPGYAVVANLNSPQQTVISGEPAAVSAAIKQAETEGIRCRRLPVSNAFHSKLVAKAADILREKAPIPEELVPTGIMIFSGITGKQVLPGLNLREHFADQVLAKVDFLGVIQSMATQCDLFLEVGPGRVLSGLANDILENEDSGGQSAAAGPASGPQTPTPEPQPPILCLPVEPEPGRDRDFNCALAAVFVHGIPVRWNALYENRLVRPYVPPAKRIFIDNPCERPFRVSDKDVGGPISGYGGQLESLIAEAAGVPPEKVSEYVAQRGKFLAEVARADLLTTPLPPVATKAQESQPGKGGEQQVKGAEADVAQSASDLLLDLVEKRTGFPRNTLNLDMRLLDDLNLDSIKAAELIAQAAKQMNVAGRIDTLKSANATLAQVAEALEKLKTEGGGPQTAAGSARPTWVRNFGVEFVPGPAVAPRADELKSEWGGGKVLVMHEPAEQDVADALRDRFVALGGEARCASFAEAREQNLAAEPGFTHLVTVLPRQADAAEELLTTIGRLQVTVPAARTAPAKPAHVAYIQFGGGDFGGAHSGPADRTEPAAINQCCSAAFAASLHLEQENTKVRVLDFAPGVSPVLLAEKVAVELTAASGYAAVGFNGALERRVPVVRVHEPTKYRDRGVAWSDDDVVLFTGGARGIGAECALALACKTGVKLALVGSSPLPEDPESEVARTLARFRADGLTASYYQCDVTSPDSVTQLVRDVREQLGVITAVVHGAAINVPRNLDRCSAQEAFDEVSPKLLGARNLSSALADSPPRLLVGITSVIGLTGMSRNGWYGFSNEALGLVLDRFRAEHPETQVQTIAYSVWTEAGMGVRLGTARLAADIGLGGISNAEGTGRFLRLFERAADTRDVLVTGPLGRYASATWPAEASPVPADHRFLESVLAAQHGVSATARARLTLERDVYLRDHNYNGSYLFPTVFGLEAMAQAAAYVLGNGSRGPGVEGSSENKASGSVASVVQNPSESSSCLGVFVVNPPGSLRLRIEDIRLERPIVVDPDKGLTIEIWAEVQERESADGPLKVKAAIGTEHTGYATDHFAATFVLGEGSRGPGAKGSSEEAEPDSEASVAESPDDSSSSLSALVVDTPVPVPIVPKRDLYGRYLFQGPMFQRLERVDSLDSKQAGLQARYDLPACAGAFAVMEPAGSVSWRFVLGDPFFLDSLLQSPQLLIPRDVALPVHIDSIEYDLRAAVPTGSIRAVAATGERKEQDVACSVTAFDANGGVLLRLDGYTVRVLEHHPENPTAEELADPGERDQRLLREVLAAASTALGVRPPTLVLGHVPGIHDMKKAERREAELPLFGRALSSLSFTARPSSPVEYLPTGKPVIAGPNPDNVGVSDSHDGDVYIVVAGKGPTGCDLAAITTRSHEDWLALLGNEQEQLLEELLESGDSLDTAGTRIWSARETVRKALDSVEFSIAFDRREGPAVLFHGTAGGQRVTLLTVPVRLTRGPHLLLAVTTTAG